MAQDTEEFTWPSKRLNAMDVVLSDYNFLRFFVLIVCD